jgi:flagellar motor switch protein FliN/FliY
MPQMDPQMGYGQQMPYGQPMAGYGMPPMGYMQPMYGQPMAGYGMPPQNNVNVQSATFQNFAASNTAPGHENIDLIMDVPLEVTVELGRTSKSIKDILEFAPGTIVELNKIAGEPIDVLVNGKYVAKGEVVVIEESFGIKITEIIK